MSTFSCTGTEKGVGCMEMVGKWLCRKEMYVEISTGGWDKTDRQEKNNG